MSELLVVLSNIGVAAATGLLIFVTVHDVHHHDEKVAREDDLHTEHLIETVLEHERQRDSK